VCVGVCVCVWVCVCVCVCVCERERESPTCGILALPQVDFPAWLIVPA